MGITSFPEGMPTALHAICCRAIITYIYKIFHIFRAYKKQVNDFLIKAMQERM
ncbi:hypothetical protein DEHRE_03850 [Dehalobacter restrictus DSM 9455]|uniref:Uncharacterized protein n=1 Tax=Dehalobacter restrictus (strain DSM 9455 / PER-K23) TaxID=871738 RepID=A0ABN4BV53_DEHRP|nr:hypothetical protein DEHRE_03850 [Dehalobacter restrictus DSM 9455]